MMCSSFFYALVCTPATTPATSVHLAVNNILSAALMDRKDITDRC